MTDLIEALQEMDRMLVQSIDVEIRPVLMLEDIETGSLRVWLKTFLEAIPDESLKEAEWKKALGYYLVKGKYILLDWAHGRTTVTDRREVIELQREVLSLAEETNVRHIPMYAPIPPKQLVQGVQKVSDATMQLRPNESASYETRTGEVVPFTMTFGVSPQTLEELLTKETIENSLVLILKVKKPDYLGDSMWDLKHEGRTIPAKILDADWLAAFQERKVDVRPGDALRAEVAMVIRYGFDGEVVGMSYTINRVLEIVKAEPPEQRLPGA